MIIGSVLGAVVTLILIASTMEDMIMEPNKVIARVTGISGNVTVRAYIKVAAGYDVAAVSTKDGNVYYVDTKLIEIMEVSE